MTLIDAEAIAQSATSLYALSALSLLSFSESAFFIIPPEVLLIPMALAIPSKALIFGLLTSAVSLAGALFGYWIGQKGGKPILKKLFKEESVKKVKILFHKYDAWTILVAAFTPLPYKLATISAGAFDIDLKRFTIASAIGRTSRYMLIASLLYIFGEPIKFFIEHQLNQFLLVATLVAVTGYTFYKYFIPYCERKFLKESISDKLSRIFTKER